MTGIALAEPPGATDAKPTSADVGTPDHGQSVTYMFGADGHVGLGGGLIESNVAGRFELGIAPGHALTLRAGVGTMAWMDTEVDDPIWRELFARIGYRISSRYLFLGVELGDSWFKAHYLPEMQPPDKPQWFDKLTVTAAAGLKLGPVRVSLDYTYPFGQVGAQLGVDVLSL